MKYKMTDEQLAKILDACRPVPYLVMGGMPPSSPQENANRAWAALGQELGFDHITVRDAGTGDQREFFAEPVEA